MRYAAKRDITEREIVEALEALGFSVERMDFPCDLACGFRGKTYLVECKTPTKQGGKDKATPKQKRFLETWRGNYTVLRSADEAIEWGTKIARNE
jgi:hypothetical protein